MFINLFLLSFATYGFNHVAARKNFVQHTFAENFVPAARAAGGNPANYNRFFHKVVFILRYRARVCGRGLFALGLNARWGIRSNPVYKCRVKRTVVTVHVSTSPLNMNTRGNKISKQIIKFYNATFLGVVRSHYFDVFFVRQRIGG